MFADFIVKNIGEINLFFMILDSESAYLQFTICEDVKPTQELLLAINEFGSRSGGYTAYVDTEWDKLLLVECIKCVDVRYFENFISNQVLDFLWFVEKDEDFQKVLSLAKKTKEKFFY